MINYKKEIISMIEEMENEDFLARRITIYLSNIVRNRI